MQPTDELYRKYAHVITAVVNRYAWQFPELEDDLYLQAGLVFCQACLTYDENHPSHASFRTWLENKLHSITDLIDRWNNGPTTLKGKGSTPAVLHEPVDSHDEDDCIPMSGIYPAAGFLDGYSANLLDYSTSEYPDRMKLTVDNLEGDALQIFRDWCAGRLDKSKNSSGVKKRRDERKTLNPMRIYRRRYMSLGWTFERTRKAWGDFTRAFKPYAGELLPGILGVA